MICGVIINLLATSLTLCGYNDATSEHYSLYLCAQYSQQQKQDNLIEAYYTRLFNAKAPVFAHAGYLEHLFSLGNYSSIVRLIPQIIGFFDNHKDIQIIIGQSLEFCGKKYEAENVFINLYQHHKNQADVAYYAAAAYTRRNGFLQALTIIDDYLNSSVEKPIHFMFYFLKSKIYQFLNNEKEAVESLKKGLKLYRSIKGITFNVPINVHLPLVSGFMHEAFSLFDASLVPATNQKQQKKLILLWKKLHS